MAERRTRAARAGQGYGYRVSERNPNRRAQAKGRLAELAASVPIPHGTEGLVESCWLLLTSVVAVPIVCSFPGGSAVLGFLARARRPGAPAAPRCLGPARRAWPVALPDAAARLVGPAWAWCCAIPGHRAPGVRARHARMRPATNHAHGQLPDAARLAACRSAPAWRPKAGIPIRGGRSAQAGGALIGPHALGIVRDVEGVRHLAELGVVFLLFNIGLELSLDRLRSMQKFVFGLGSLQARGRPPCPCARPAAAMRAGVVYPNHNPAHSSLRGTRVRPGAGYAGGSGVP